MNTGKHKFFISCGGQAFCFGFYAVKAAGADRAAGIWDDTIGTEVVAAIFNFYICPYAALAAGNGKLFIAVLFRNVLHLVQDGIFGGLPDKFDNLAAVFVANNKVCAKGFDFFVFCLGKTAADGNHCIGIFLTGAADLLPGFLCACTGDGTGVDDINVGFFTFLADGISGCTEKLGHCLAFINIGFASECYELNCYFCHILAHFVK